MTDRDEGIDALRERVRLAVRKTRYVIGQRRQPSTAVLVDAALKAIGIPLPVLAQLADGTMVAVPIGDTNSRSKGFVGSALRSAVDALLARCTPHQRSNFDRFFPGGVGKQNQDKLETAFDLCQRTLHKAAAVSPPAQPSGERAGREQWLTGSTSPARCVSSSALS